MKTCLSFGKQCLRKANSKLLIRTQVAEGGYWLRVVYVSMILLWSGFLAIAQPHNILLERKFFHYEKMYAQLSLVSNTAWVTSSGMYYSATRPY